MNQCCEDFYLHPLVKRKIIRKTNKEDCKLNQDKLNPITTLSIIEDFKPKTRDKSRTNAYS